MFKNIPNVDFSAFGAPVQKLIELNTETFTKAFELQKASVEKMIAQAKADFKALTEIKDVESLTSFVTVKSEEAKASLEALKTEAEASVESTKAYFAEVQAILTESTSDAAPVAKAEVQVTPAEAKAPVAPAAKAEVQAEPAESKPSVAPAAKAEVQAQATPAESKAPVAPAAKTSKAAKAPAKKS